jgi:hypothetical protein
MKQEDPGKIIQALETILDGKLYFSSAILEKHKARQLERIKAKLCRKTAKELRKFAFEWRLTQ